MTKVGRSFLRRTVQTRTTGELVIGLELEELTLVVEKCGVHNPFRCRFRKEDKCCGPAVRSRSGSYLVDACRGDGFVSGVFRCLVRGPDGSPGALDISLYEQHPRCRMAALTPSEKPESK